MQLAEQKAIEITVTPHAVGSDNDISESSECEIFSILFVVKVV